MICKRLFRVIPVFLILFSMGADGQTGKKTIESRPVRFERSHDFDVRHYRLSFQFNEKEKSFTGEATIRFVPLRDDFSECRLDAVGLQIDSVCNESGNPLTFRTDEESLQVIMARPRSYGEIAALTVKYNCRNPKRGMKFIDQSPGHPAQINTYNWPQEARCWFPCYDYPNDKATNEIIATVRDGWRVLSNGRLQEVRENGSARTRTYHWIQDKPHPTYCIMLAAGPYTVIEDHWGEVPVSYWVYPEDENEARPVFSITPEIMEFYSRRFGVPFPWAKYDQVCVAGYGGGLENTSATLLGDGVIVGSKGRKDFSSLGLIAHELAHQWWGDLVTERDWSHVWLSESFATYSEYLFCREKLGEDQGALNLEKKKESYLREARKYIRPVVDNRYNNPWEVMDSHSYPKGACILHMLRFVMGDDPFFRTLKRFLEEFAFQSVDTHDFQRTIKEVTGQNLDWFFDQWLYSPGHPVFEVSSEWDDKSMEMILHVRQVQDTARGIPVFRLPVIIALETDGKRIERKVWLEKSDETFRFPCPEKPQMVRFDTGNHLLKEWSFPKTVEELVFQLEHDDIIGRKWAAGQLKGVKDHIISLPALRRTVESAQNGEVRSAALEVLSGFPGACPLHFLERLCRDGDPLVRAGAVRCLGKTQKNNRVKFLRSLFPAEESYLVQVEILKALAESGDKNLIPFLKECAAIRSPRNIIARAAKEALRSLGVED